jgi:hypothetical protein
MLGRGEVQASDRRRRILGVQPCRRGERRLGGDLGPAGQVVPACGGEGWVVGPVEVGGRRRRFDRLGDVDRPAARLVAAGATMRSVSAATSTRPSRFTTPASAAATGEVTSFQGGDRCSGQTEWRAM